MKDPKTPRPDSPPVRPKRSAWVRKAKRQLAEKWDLNRAIGRREIA